MILVVIKYLSISDYNNSNSNMYIAKFTKKSMVTKAALSAVK